MSANELHQAASPYLLQHASNPVHWRMWTPTALQEARELQKPILLSIGYAACHWCHVMAHESFEDPATAEVMNELFVNIKVDREERPDIDHIYMTCLHALGQQGGWPLTMFLTPQGEAFWGGTYFPKVAHYGRPAFMTVLKSVAAAFRAEPQKIAANSKAIRARLTQSIESASRAEMAELSLELLNDVALALANLVDPVNGGLRGAPKFPNPPLLEFLWRADARLQGAPYRELVRLTLTRMSEGGIYDHLGGGYARYSTDERWLVPHFEKMLYDNAQILELLALCHAKTGDELFRTRAKETVGWLQREMTHQKGAFCASLDADSEGAEGKFYVWTWDELTRILGPQDAAFFSEFYGASATGNWSDDHFGTVTVLNRLDATRPTPQEEARLAASRRALLDARERRVRPALDDKIMADWNGLMIAALVNAATLFAEPEWVGLAARAYDFIVATMRYVDGDKRVRLAHSWRAGALVRPGMALDYAAMIRAALALHEARNWSALPSTLDRNYLSDAVSWAETLETCHLDGQSGLLCMAASDATDVILRLSPTADDAIPNSHPVYLLALIRLAGLSGDDRWLKRADELLDALRPAALANPIAHAGTLNAFDFRLRAKQVVTAGPQRRELYEAALGAPFVERIIMDIDRPEMIPATIVGQAQADLAGDAAAFVCAGGACSLPLRSAEALLDALASTDAKAPE
jgi:uncharacterized protein